MPQLRTHLFTIEVAGQWRTAVLLCSGPMVHGSIAILQAALAAATETEAPVVEVDLRKVSQLDRGAAIALLQARHDLARQGRELRLAVDAPADRFLRRWGASELLDARPSAAVNLSRRPRSEESQEGRGS